MPALIKTQTQKQSQDETETSTKLKVKKKKNNGYLACLQILMMRRHCFRPGDEHPELTLSDTIAGEMPDANEELRPEEALIYNFTRQVLT